MREHCSAGLRAGHPAMSRTMRDCGAYVYILASRRNGSLCIVVTGDTPARITAHREGRGSEFGRKYGVAMLVWFEHHPLHAAAIQRETSLKRWNRAWKLRLIEEMNPDWEDLFLKWNA
jgi:putative endonuclease